jgi:pimeloyl-ACP methyl ester carboxylesterase
VVAPSRFGYLRTPQRSDATPQAQADAHACLLDALRIPRAAIVGVSAGAPSAMQFALRHERRCSALVLLVPMVYSPELAARFPPPSAWSRWLFEHLVDSDFLFWLAARGSPHRLLGTPSEVLGRADEMERARFEHFVLQPLPVSERREGMLNDATVVTHLQRYDLEHVALPTLAISAAHSWRSLVVLARRRSSVGRPPPRGDGRNRGVSCRERAVNDRPRAGRTVTIGR